MSDPLYPPAGVLVPSGHLQKSENPGQCRTGERHHRVKDATTASPKPSRNAHPPDIPSLLISSDQFEHTGHAEHLMRPALLENRALGQA